MSLGVRSPGRAHIEAKTLRQDRWWLYPAVTFTVFAGVHHLRDLARVLRPRLLLGAVPLAVLLAVPRPQCVEGSSDFGQPFSWWQLSPALIILIFPLGFRLTCYYYRKAYYRSFWLSPPACGGRRAAREVHRRDAGSR